MVKDCDIVDLGNSRSTSISVHQMLIRAQAVQSARAFVLSLCFAFATADGWIVFCGLGHRKHWRAATALFTTLGYCVFLQLILTNRRLQHETALSNPALSNSSSVTDSLIPTHLFLFQVLFLGMFFPPAVHCHAFTPHTVDCVLPRQGWKLPLWLRNCMFVWSFTCLNPSQLRGFVWALVYVWVCAGWEGNLSLHYIKGRQAKL